MSLVYSAGGAMPLPSLEWQFESSNVDSVSGLTPNLSTTGTFAAPTGGTITTVGANRVHSFTTVGTTSITFLVPVTAQVLVVAGGGGGGGNNISFSSGGGGGAGEFYTSASYSIAAGTYAVTVGAGGTAGIALGADGGDGGDSVFGSISANGGGGGSTGGSARPGRNGGSGGGCGREGAVTGGTSEKTPGGLGNKGGDCVEVSSVSAGGGGGSATAGANATASGATPVLGGTGTNNSIRTGVGVTYAAGGTGGARSGTYTPGAGTANRGNGGAGAPGGGTAGSNARNGGVGGSGIVVISYNAAIYPAPTYVQGEYGQAIRLNNTLSPAGADPNSYVTYDVTSFGLSSNSTTMSLWLNSGLTYPTTAGTTPFYVNLQGANYNGLYTSSATSNISFRKGTSPATTIGNVAAQTSVWQHHCMVFSNIGAGATSNTFSSYYVNGSFIATANNTIQGFTTLNLGCQDSGSNGALCSIDDVRIFGQSLTSLQVQSIYNQQGMPGRGVTDGPQAKIFLGPLLRYPTATGTEPTNDGTKLTFTRASSQFLNFGSQTFDMTQGFSATCRFAFFGTAVAYERIFDLGKGENNDNLILCRNNLTQQISFYFQNGVTQYFASSTNSFTQGQVNTLTAIYTHSPVSIRIVLNGVATTATPGAAATTPRTLTICYVGESNWASDAYSNLDIYSLNIYNRALTPSELAGPPAPSPWSIMTGTPLFSQLSQAASSSAVGAFSLRAVNGTSARAVQVVAHPVGIWPPVAMTSNTTTATGTFNGVTNGVYTASESPNAYAGQNGSFYAFDNNPTGSFWHSNVTYNADGTYNGTTTQTDGYTGEWLQIKFPTPIILYSYSMINRSGFNGRTPRNFRILGSTNGTDWTIVDARTDVTGWIWPTRREFTITNPVLIPYTYFRIVINRANGSNSIQISSWILNGPAAVYTTGSPTDFYADRLGNLLTAPVVGQLLEDWLGSATGYVTTWYDQSGRGNHATQTTAANQPIIQRATKGPGYMVNFNGTSQFVTLSASYNFLNGTNITVNAVALRTATISGQNWVFGTNSASVSYQRIAIGFETDTTLDPLGNSTNSPGITIPAYSSGEQVYYMTGVLSPSRVVYSNDVVGGTNADTVLLSVPVGTQFSIGRGGTGGVVYYNGNLFELLIFTSALNQAQVTQVYQNQLGAYGT